MLRLEPRQNPSNWMVILSPILAVLITFLFLIFCFLIMEKDVVLGLKAFVVNPFTGARGFMQTGPRALSELALKATPLLLCALGLALCFRSNIFNIGAEGQFIFGAIAGGGAALWFSSRGIMINVWLFMPLGMLAGALGGMFWASIVAFLRDKFNANEILVSLMLVYVADFFLKYLVFGPWRNPDYSFPQTIMFASDTLLPRIFPGLRMHWGGFFALLMTLILWVYLYRTYKGYQLQVSGLSPAAARYAGFSARFSLWSCLLISGALAGIAGSFEVLGPMGQLTEYAGVGYGFTAIIVAYIARLNPVGCILASVLLAVILIGGEHAQMLINVPASFSKVLQGVLLLALMASDTFIFYRIRRRQPTIKPTILASVKEGSA